MIYHLAVAPEYLYVCTDAEPVVRTQAVAVVIAVVAAEDGRKY
jgi:hypothetical protein